MNCAPAWYGFCLAADYVRLDSFLHRFVKLGYVEHSAIVTDMFLKLTTRCFVDSVQQNTRSSNVPS